MRADNLGSQGHDYFEPPTCSEAVADMAYRSFVRQEVEAGVAFGPWLDSRAWMAAFHLLESAPSDS
ncbi:MAG: hypothetical protein KIT22_15535 [Verrucomicrobiae bacterium]|nr:hypothetical protein [Verrucomicrobiae bacterium]